MELTQEIWNNIKKGLDLATNIGLGILMSMLPSEIDEYIQEYKRNRRFDTKNPKNINLNHTNKQFSNCFSQVSFNNESNSIQNELNSKKNQTILNKNVQRNILNDENNPQDSFQMREL